MELYQLISIILSGGAMVVGIAVMLTRKDSTLHEKIKVSEVRDEERFKTVYTTLDKIDLKLGNHIAHSDARIDIKLENICNSIMNIDKSLYAHLQNHDLINKK